MSKDNLFFGCAFEVARLYALGEATNPAINDFLKNFGVNSLSIPAFYNSNAEDSLNRYGSLDFAQFAKNAEEEIENYRKTEIDELLRPVTNENTKKQSKKTIKRETTNCPRTLREVQREKQKQLEKLKETRKQFMKPAKPETLKQNAKDQEKFYTKYDEQIMKNEKANEIKTKKKTAKEKLENRKKYGKKITEENQIKTKKNPSRRTAPIEKEKPPPNRIVSIENYEKKMNAKLKQYNTLLNSIDECMQENSFDISELKTRLEDPNAFLINDGAETDYALRYYNLFDDIEKLEDRIRTLKDELDISD